MKKLLTVEDMCDMLSLTRDKFHRLLRNGRGPKKITLSPKIFRFDPEDVEEWIAKQKEAE